MFRNHGVYDILMPISSSANTNLESLKPRLFASALNAIPASPRPDALASAEILKNGTAVIIAFGQGSPDPGSTQSPFKF